MDESDLDRVNTADVLLVAHGTSSVPILRRALEILELLAASRDGLPLPEISRALSMPKSSAHKVLITLLREGYVNRSQRTGRFSLGHKLFTLANQALEGLRIREVAIPPMRQLMMQTQLTVHLATLESFEAVLLAKIVPPGLPSLSTWIGRRMEVHCTGVGKALIAYLPDEDLDKFLQARVFARHNDNTIVSPKRLRAELETVRKNRYAIDDEEDELGMRCLGAPIVGEDGQLLAAISIAGTVTQVNDANRRDLADKLLRTAAVIAKAMSEDTISQS
jgi:DNA-binding IclR family transcriptional regulator